MKSIFYCLALALALSALTATAQEPALSSVEAQFDTTKDNKNSDSRLDVYVKNNLGREIGKSEGNEGVWDKHSTHTLSLQIEGNSEKAQVVKGSIVLTFHPHGADDWKFDYKVTLKFSDGSSIVKELFGCVLTEYNTARTDRF